MWSMYPIQGTSSSRSKWTTTLLWAFGLALRPGVAMATRCLGLSSTRSFMDTTYPRASWLASSRSFCTCSRVQGVSTSTVSGLTASHSMTPTTSTSMRIRWHCSIRGLTMCFMSTWCYFGAAPWMSSWVPLLSRRTLAVVVWRMRGRDLCQGLLGCFTQVPPGLHSFGPAMWPPFVSAVECDTMFFIKFRTCKDNACHQLSGRNFFE
jgi:hypothetical protein